MTVSQPLHFVAAVVVGSPGLDLFAWSLTALAMAMVALELIRSPSMRHDARLNEPAYA